MTITVADTRTPPPTFGDCPTWCDRNGLHEPLDEVGDRDGVGILIPRLHETTIHRGAVQSLTHVVDATVYIDVAQFDHGSYGGHPESDPPVATVLIEGRDREGRPTSIATQPTADQLRALIAAYTQALDLLEGVTR